jgi:sarcosine oxidase subunit beta
MVMEELETDVAIVGGGIMGCSAALHLCRLGRSVVLLERGFVGAQASGVNFGNVRQQGRYLPQLPLSARSREIWDRLETLLGEACEFVAGGNLYLAHDEAQAAELERFAAGAAAYDFAVEILGANTVRERWPWLGPGIVMGSFTASDGHANPRLLTPAFARAAAAAGARIVEQAEVADLGHDGGRFRLETNAGIRVRSEVLLNTAGAWGPAIAAAFGEPVELTAKGPQMAVTEPLPPFIEPTVALAGGALYLRQVARGNVVFGGGERGPALVDENRAYVLPENTLAAMARARRLVPALASAHVIRVWSGIEGYMADDLPVIGPSRTRPGLFHAFGFCGHGFQLGPGVGAVLAELAATGATETPIADFAIDRFA